MANEIEVRVPGEWERTDSDIARAAVNVLEWNTLVPQDRVQVLVQKGWITLDGTMEFHTRGPKPRGPFAVCSA